MPEEDGFEPLEKHRNKHLLRLVYVEFILTHAVSKRVNE